MESFFLKKLLKILKPSIINRSCEWFLTLNEEFHNWVDLFHEVKTDDDNYLIYCGRFCNPHDIYRYIINIRIDRYEDAFNEINEKFPGTVKYIEHGAYWDFMKSSNFHIHYIWPFDIIPMLIKMGYKMKPNEMSLENKRYGYWGSCHCEEDICEKAWEKFWKYNKSGN